MKYVFFGTPEFAAIILEKLIKAGMPPAVVVCNPDRPVGREKILTPPPAKFSAEKYNIPILQPEVLDSRFQLLDSSFDFFVVAAYAKILPKEIIELPRLGTMGVHPSLLPKYRGATPIQSAILAGEKETGTTIFLLDEKVDHGPMLVTGQLDITTSDNYETLLKKLAELSGDLLIKTLPQFIAGKMKPIPQDETKATYTKKFTTEDAKVDLEKDDPEMILRKIRALNPEPGVFALSQSKGGLKRTKILDADLKDGKIHPTKIQIAGKKPTLNRIL
ncbi:MAG: methionyl-tRNA formyltransferase [Candidatus Harrisonbacteria bacterium]|nr:methionyl-tRNA formyltransferase [Candidatus Harrisonbacteria bacterium]